MKFTKEKLKEIIKEEFEKIEETKYTSDAFKGIKIGTDTDRDIERHQLKKARKRGGPRYVGTGPMPEPAYGADTQIALAMTNMFKDLYRSNKELALQRLRDNEGAREYLRQAIAYDPKQLPPEKYQDALALLEINQDLSEAEDVDLASLEPAVDSMVAEIEKAAEAASEGQESLKNLLMQSLIAKLQGMID